MADAPTFAETMVAKYEALLASNVGVRSVNVDGVQVAYDDLIVQWEYWRKRVAIEQGSRPRVAKIRLDRF